MASRDSDFALLEFPSEMMERDVVLLHEQFQIPSTFQLKILRPNNRVCRPPPGRMSLYKECFPTRLRLPLHFFFITLFQYLEMSPCSIVSNSWRHICNFTVVCVLARIDASIALFHAFFSLKRHPDSYGWWYMMPQRKKNVRPLIQDTLTAVHIWKGHFLFSSKTLCKDCGLIAWDKCQEAVLKEPSLDQHRGRRWTPCTASKSRS